MLRPKEVMTDAFACSLAAIQIADQGHYRELASRVRAALRTPVETANGYVFDLCSGALDANELAEWIQLERLCCPFLTIELSAFETLTLSGPPGIKQLIQAEFAAASPAPQTGS